MRLRGAAGAAAVAALIATGGFGVSAGAAIRTIVDTESVGFSTSPRALTAPGRCSKAAAQELVERHRLDAFLVPNPIAQLLCGPFTGPGSDAMAITIRAPTCWGVQRWAIFRFTQGDWRLALDRTAFIFPLVVVGADIRETTPVFRPGDARCLPSGGKRARTWHWSGTRFTAGPWKQVTPGAAAPAVPGFSGFFKLPSGNVVCGYGYGSKIPRAFVGCRIKSGLKPPPAPDRPGCSTTDDLFLGPTGRTTTGRTICPGEPEGDAGVLAYEHVARVLGYGKTWSGGGLSCASAVSGLTCRNKSDHGFFLSRAAWRAF